jgi:hypothetical protein
MVLSYELAHNDELVVVEMTMNLIVVKRLILLKLDVLMMKSLDGYDD